MNQDNLSAIVADIGPLAIERLAGKTVFLTGSGGFLGQSIVQTIDWLNAFMVEDKTPIRLIALDAIEANQVHRDLLLRPERVEFINNDLSFDIGVQEKVDYCIHMAGIASPYWYQKMPLKTFDVSVEGSRKVLELAKRNNARYLFTSSSEVYQAPPADQIPTPETYVGAIPLDSVRSAYDIGKAAGEALTHIYHREFGLETIIIRIFNSFSEGMKEKDHRILPRLGSAFKAGRPLRIFASKADPSQLPTRTYCPAANTIVGAFRALLLGVPGEVYNIGVSSPEITVMELAQRAANILGRAVNYELVESPNAYTTEPMRRCPSIEKARAVLGYKPIVDLDAGLYRFLTWAMKEYSGSL